MDFSPKFSDFPTYLTRDMSLSPTKGKALRSDELSPTITPSRLLFCVVSLSRLRQATFSIVWICITSQIKDLSSNGVHLKCNEAYQ
jgi:hypothetical protein